MLKNLKRRSIFVILLCAGLSLDTKASYEECESGAEKPLRCGDPVEILDVDNETYWPALVPPNPEIKTLEKWVHNFQSLCSLLNSHIPNFVEGCLVLKVRDYETFILDESFQKGGAQEVKEALSPMTKKMMQNCYALSKTTKNHFFLRSMLTLWQTFPEEKKDRETFLRKVSLYKAFQNWEKRKLDKISYTHALYQSFYEGDLLEAMMENALSEGAKLHQAYEKKLKQGRKKEKRLFELASLLGQEKGFLLAKERIFKFFSVSDLICEMTKLEDEVLHLKKQQRARKKIVEEKISKEKQEFAASLAREAKHQYFISDYKYHFLTPKRQGTQPDQMASSTVQSLDDQQDKEDALEWIQAGKTLLERDLTRHIQDVEQKGESLLKHYVKLRDIALLIEASQKPLARRKKSRNEGALSFPTAQTPYAEEDYPWFFYLQRCLADIAALPYLSKVAASIDKFPQNSTRK